MFRKCSCEGEAKKLFRKLCMFLHPDKGGTQELMTLLLESYESTCNSFLEKESSSSTKNDDDPSRQQCKDVFHDLKDMYEELEMNPPKFVKSVLRYFCTHGRLSWKQFESLLSIQERLHDLLDDE